MSAGPDRRAAARGFTLIELVVTIALIAIMASLAVPSFVAFQRSSQLTGVANQFIGAVSAARAEAMKRNHNAYLLPAINGVPTYGNDWTVGWMVFVDMSNPPTSTTYQAGTDVLVMQGDAFPTTITTPATAGVTQFTDATGTYVMFNGAGFPRRVGSATAIAPTQSLDFVNGSSTAFGSSRRRILVNATGRMRICTPATANDATCPATDN